MKVQTIIFLIVGLFKISWTLREKRNITGRNSLVIEEEDTSVLPKFYDGSRQDFACSIGSECIPLSDCHVMTQLLKRSCLQSDKLRGLTCGSRGNEPLVCCPQTCSSPRPNPGPTPFQCGRPQISNWWSTNYFGLGSHPWVVRVGFRNSITNSIDYLCGGSIINRQTVLTAAHCALAKTATHKIATVRVGEYNIDQDQDCTFGTCADQAQDIPLNHIVVHPNYDSKTFSNNIAILILKEPLNYSLSIQPICIYPKNRKYNFVNRKVLLIGWGKLSGQGSAPSTQQQLQLPILPMETCSLLYGSTVPITQNMLCAGGEGQDACSGFGGAPLVILDPSTKSCYYQIGFLSFGSDRCGEPGIPSIYTRLDSYIDWINLNSAKV